MTDLLSVGIEAGIALITFKRPERLNAMNAEMGLAFEQAMADAERDEAVRVVVITGTGRGFCAGADMERLTVLVADGGQSLHQAPADGGAPPLEALTGVPQVLRRRYLSPMALSKPVIAAINGAVAGVGFSLAVACDIRFASHDGFFTAAFPKRGLTAEAGLAWTLPALIGRGAASDMLLSGRRVSAEEAFSMGLVNAVVSADALLPHALAYAREMAASCSPRSMRVIKRQLRLGQDQDMVTALEMSMDEVVASLTSADFAEGVASFKDKRPPRFTGV